MGVSGIFKEIGPGQRISLAALAADHFSTHAKPFRLAIDISIWLFQIQAGKGGSNPALRTFYYRLLRLLTLNIHPLFVFDGPNKPLFKRNKRVGGPGVRVVNVPEFLAKQLLKQFAFPWHVAPGEAEAECALLQREGLVDAVLSEDVDTLMFGSGVTLRSWTPEGSGKTPTHVNVYRAEKTKTTSGLDREGMILVALMSGGDYIVEGIPGCGPKVACDAARAGFGKDLCALAKKKDVLGLQLWREKLRHELKTNESKLFKRKSTKMVIPDDFPNSEVLGYYTHPCLSTPEKISRLRESLKWDLPIDFPALRAFAGDAFDWRCLGGAKKFIRNLAPAMLVRELRLRGEQPPLPSEEAQAEREKEVVLAIHGKRNHSTTDGALEYRISVIPATFVPIDLSAEPEDDEFTPAGGVDEGSDAESECPMLASTQAAAATEEDGAPVSPSKKRVAKPYDPAQPEKLWIIREYLKIGCPLVVEDYESVPDDPKEFFKARRKARAAAAGDGNLHTKKVAKKKGGGMPQNALMAYASVMKSSQASSQASSAGGREPLREGNVRAKPRPANDAIIIDGEDEDEGALPKAKTAGFKMPSTQFISAPRLARPPISASAEDDDDNWDFTPKASQRPAPSTQQLTTAPPRSFAPFAHPPHASSSQASSQLFNLNLQKTPPRRKRRSASAAVLSSPALPLSQRNVDDFFAVTPRKAAKAKAIEVIDLLSPPVAQAPSRARTPPLPAPTIPPDLRTQSIRSPEPAPERATSRDSLGYSPGKLPDTVTKRRKKSPFKRYRTAPVSGFDNGDDNLDPLPASMDGWGGGLDLEMDLRGGMVEAMDLAGGVSPASSLPSPSSFLAGRTSSASLAKASELVSAVVSVPPLRLRAAEAPTSLLARTESSKALCLGSSSRPASPQSRPATTTTSRPASSQSRLQERQAPTPSRPNTATSLRPTSKLGHPSSRPSSSQAPSSRPVSAASTTTSLSTSTQIPPAAAQGGFRLPPQPLPKKKTHIAPRNSLPGTWKLVDSPAASTGGSRAGGGPEVLDLSGDGSGWKVSKGRAALVGSGWRKSGVEVVDLTGAGG